MSSYIYEIWLKYGWKFVDRKTGGCCHAARSVWGIIVQCYCGSGSGNI